VCIFNCYEYRYLPLFMVYSVWVVCFMVCYEAMEKVGNLPLVGCRRNALCSSGAGHFCCCCDATFDAES
jgi:hypothetical protein